MRIEQLIIKYRKNLGELDNVILRYIMENLELVKTLSIVELAQRTHTSKSTILRLTRKIGFEGYSEFKYFLRLSEEELDNKENLNVFKAQLVDVQRTVEDLIKLNNQELNELMLNSQTIYCYGTGFTQRNAAEEFAKAMLRYGKRVIVIPNKTELDMAMPIITSSDMMLLTSLSGETTEIKDNILTFNIRSVPLVTITSYGPNFFANHSDYALHFYATPFSAGKQALPTRSLVGLFCVTDYLFRSFGQFIKKRGEGSEVVVDE